ncbi:MAG: tRNA (adenine-N1)-methyltransferase [Nitrospirae bacterium]|nr:MAG: tRNA (adenine-N1)-methyltransferase [Nitrospirota bacterium]
MKEGDTVCLFDEKNRFFITLQSGETFTTHRGKLSHDDIIGLNWGQKVRTHKGHEYILLRPTLYELIMFGIRRKTQIVYPKDSAYICLKLGLRPGMKVLEIGLGSGAMTAVMANILGPEGRVYAYEREDRFIENAMENLKLTGHLQWVEIKKRDVLEEAVDERSLDAGFVDMREPWLALSVVREGLKRTAPVAFILPTTNQVSELLKALQEEGFIDITVEEIVQRPYKPVPDRLRPVDIMSAHTGYIVFARTPGDEGKTGQN